METTANRTYSFVQSESSLIIWSFILGQVATVRQEIEAKNRRLTADNESIARLVLSNAGKDTHSFLDEQSERNYYASAVRKAAWYCANVEEFQPIIDRLKSNDRQFAAIFFYGTDTKACNISRFRSSILTQIKQSYNIHLTVQEFGDVLYTYLWCDGTWKNLDGYKYQGNFFSWLKEVARSEIKDYMVEMGMLHPKVKRTMSNTFLLGRSVEPAVWYWIIQDTMNEGVSKDLLVALLVDRKSENELMDELHVTENTFSQLKENAEKQLQDRIMCSDPLYEELVLRDKRHQQHVAYTDEVAVKLASMQVDTDEQDPLAEVFGFSKNRDEMHEEVIDFLHQFSDHLKWSKANKTIWRMRFIENLSPNHVGEKFGKDPIWVNNRYCRLNREFEQAISIWWKRRGD